MHTILVPVDGSVHAVKAVHIACDLCSKYGGRVALCHVLLSDKSAGELIDLKMSERLPGNTRDGLVKVASLKPDAEVPAKVIAEFGRTVLKVSEEQVRRRDLEAVSLEARSGDPVVEILGAAKFVQANTIVMGCRGVANQSGGAFGSVSQSVFAQADCTCIAVK